MTRLLIVDDHPLMIEGLKQIFNDVPNIMADILEDM